MKTTNVNGKSSWNTIIIGAGQAGLAAGYHLLKAGEDAAFIVKHIQRNDEGQSKA